MRKNRDVRYYMACEAGASILWGTFGVPADKIVIDDRGRRPLNVDVYDAERRYGVVVGVLREETLLRLLDVFECIVHLPLPDKSTLALGDDPTHFRAFYRSKAWEHSVSKVPVIWGGSLLHGRSKRRE